MKKIILQVLFIFFQVSLLNSQEFSIIKPSREVLIEKKEIEEFSRRALNLTREKDLKLVDTYFEIAKAFDIPNEETKRVLKNLLFVFENDRKANFMQLLSGSRGFIGLLQQSNNFPEFLILSSKFLGLIYKYLLSGFQSREDLAFSETANVLRKFLPRTDYLREWTSFFISNPQRDFEKYKKNNSQVVTTLDLSANNIPNKKETRVQIAGKEFLFKREKDEISIFDPKNNNWIATSDLQKGILDINDLNIFLLQKDNNNNDIFKISKLGKTWFIAYQYSNELDW